MNNQMENVSKQMAKTRLRLFSNNTETDLTKLQLKLMKQALEEIKSLNKSQRSGESRPSGWYAKKLGECIAKADLALSKCKKIENK